MVYDSKLRREATAWAAFTASRRTRVTLQAARDSLCWRLGRLARLNAAGEAVPIADGVQSTVCIYLARESILLGGEDGPALPH